MWRVNRFECASPQAPVYCGEAIAAELTTRSRLTSAEPCAYAKKKHLQSSLVHARTWFIKKKIIIIKKKKTGNVVIVDIYIAVKSSNFNCGYHLLTTCDHYVCLFLFYSFNSELKTTFAYNKIYKSPQLGMAGLLYRLNFNNICCLLVIPM